MCWGSRAGSKDGHLSFRLERLGQASRGARQCRGWGQHTPLPAAPFWERAETCSVSRVDHDCFKQQLCHHEPNWQDLPWQGVWGTCGWTTSELWGHMGGHNWVWEHGLSSTFLNMLCLSYHLSARQPCLLFPFNVGISQILSQVGESPFRAGTPGRPGQGSQHQLLLLEGLARLQTGPRCVREE